MKNIKSKFIDKDGKLNGKMLAGLISLILILVQQIFAAFGIKFNGDLGAIVACINTILAILGLIGVMSEPATVSVSNIVNQENE
ncbi:MAG: phage holin [Liquorilactobacillus ghanensis]|uniref:phage holin n=1 Tax=Liquorilactobacillus ghanensis TaxID=399370 RepID=UPI0039E9ACF0